MVPAESTKTTGLSIALQKLLFGAEEGAVLPVEQLLFRNENVLESFTVRLNVAINDDDGNEMQHEPLPSPPAGVLKLLRRSANHDCCSTATAPGILKASGGFFPDESSVMIEFPATSHTLREVT